MEKLEYIEKVNESNLSFKEIIDKINEIVEWCNEHDKKKSTSFADELAKVIKP